MREHLVPLDELAPGGLNATNVSRRSSPLNASNQAANSNALIAAGHLLPEEFDHLLGDVTVSRNDLAFTHSLFVQCFLPIRSLPASANQHWHVTHGSASIAIEAGRLADPTIPGNWEEREVPAGPKARLL